MSILNKYADVTNAHDRLTAVGYDPFSIQFDSVDSATRCVSNGRSILLMGTNNYLGLTFNDACMQAAIAALRDFGTGTTGSRVANGSYSCHHELEQRLARFFGSRDAMVFSTGYQANLGAISGLAGKNDVVVIDTDSHASIYDACKLSGAEIVRFRHNDAKDLERRLHRLGARQGDCLVVVEGIYSMLGDRAPLRDIAAVTRAAGAYLLVDEAHSLGVLGETGRGLSEAVGVKPDFIVGTFSKSLGSVGGFLISDIDGFEILRLVSRPYLFSASLPPSVTASVMEALKQLESRPQLMARVSTNGDLLYYSLMEAGFLLGPEPGPIVSVRLPDVGVAVQFWNMMLEEGIYLNLALPPATPSEEPLLRTSVSAAHTEADVRQTIAAFLKIGRELGLISEKGVAAA